MILGHRYFTCADCEHCVHMRHAFVWLNLPALWLCLGSCSTPLGRSLRWIVHMKHPIKFRPICVNFGDNNNLAVM